jgi:two-component system OmpR family response regulator
MILLVDDDPEFAAAADRALTEAGYRVIATNTPSRARMLAQALNSRLRLAIVDLDLPESGGLELIFSIHQKLPDLKMIAVSGVIQRSVLDIAKYMGAVEAISKPVSAEEIVAAVRRGISCAGGAA